MGGSSATRVWTKEGAFSFGPMFVTKGAPFAVTAGERNIFVGTAEVAPLPRLIVVVAGKEQVE